MKRLHDPGIWRKPWFRGLRNEAKLLWLYLLDECDCCGVWERDDEQAKFYLKIKQLPFGDLIKNVFVFCNGKKVLLKDFCTFQYGLPEKYSDSSNLHKNILNRLNYHKLSFKILDKIRNKPTVDSTVAPTVNINIKRNKEIKEENKNKKKEGTPLHSFDDSIFFDFTKFCVAIPEWTEEKCKYYYDSALNYSRSKGKKYHDWIATVRNWDSMKQEKQQQQTQNRYGRQDVSIAELKDQMEGIRLQ